MKSFNKIIAVLLAFLLIITILPVSELGMIARAEEKEEVTRYTVLVLDTSTSMGFYMGDVEIYNADTAIEYVKKSANKFLSDLLKADGTNYVAVVSYKDTASVVSDFTNEIAGLKDKIDNLSDFGARDISAGLTMANNMMATVSDGENVKKNIVLFTTGMTNVGSYNYDGTYDDSHVASNWYNMSSGIHLYAYANYALSVAETVKESSNLYVIGLFQNMEGMPEEGHNVVTLFKDTAQNIATSDEYYYPVDNPDDLEFVFGEVADDVVDDNVSDNDAGNAILINEYIEQHIEYYENDFDHEILPMKSTNLEQLYKDIDEDLSDKAYNALSDVLEALSLDIDVTNEYSVLIYEIMVSSGVCESVESLYEVALKKQAVELAKFFSDNAAKIFVKASKDEIIKIIESLDNASKILEANDVNSDDFWESIDDVSRLLRENGVLKKGETPLEVIQLLENDFYSNINNSLYPNVTDGINIIFDALETVDDAYIFMCYANAYLEASEEFKDVLKSISAVAKQKAGNHRFFKAGNRVLANQYIYADPYSKEVQYWEIYTAIDKWLKSVEDYQKDGMLYIVQKGAAGFTKKSGLAMLSEGVGIIIPGYREIKEALSIIKLTIDAFTQIDEEAKSARFISKISHLADLTVNVADNYGKSLVQSYDDDYPAFGTWREDSFAQALRFDEAINVYKGIVRLACQKGLEYENLKLAYAKKIIDMSDDEIYELGLTITGGWFNALSVALQKRSAEKQIPESTKIISDIKIQQGVVEAIHCHNTKVDYDKTTGSFIYEGMQRQVIAIACPVAVTVFNEVREQVAYLSDTTSNVKEGYEHYFFIIENTESANGSVKVVIIPVNEAYSVKIQGTGNGTMDVLVGYYDGNNINKTVTYRDIDITEKTTGSLVDSTREPELRELVIDGEQVEGVFSDDNDNYPTPTPTPTPTPDDDKISDSDAETPVVSESNRLSGNSRYETAIDISSEGWDKADTVIIASGENYPDALAGTVLAKAYNAPILLTKKASLDAKVLAEIQRLGAKNVIILGGTAAVSQGVENNLSKCFSVSRIGGANRNDTAALVALKVTSKSDAAFLVSNKTYADALSAGSAAALMGAPILYVNPDGTIPAETADALKQLGCTKAYIIGGNAAVDASAESKLKALNIDSERVYGNDRYLTSVAVYNKFEHLFTSDDAAIATGKDFPDALSGVALAAKNGMPVFLVGDSAPSILVAKFDNMNVKTLYVFGGVNAISEAVVNSLTK